MKSWQRQRRYVRTRLFLQRKDFVRTYVRELKNIVILYRSLPCAPRPYVAPLVTFVRAYVITCVRTLVVRSPVGPTPSARSHRATRHALRVAMLRWVNWCTHVRTYART